MNSKKSQSCFLPSLSTHLLQLIFIIIFISADIFQKIFFANFFQLISFSFLFKALI